MRAIFGGWVTYTHTQRGGYSALRWAKQKDAQDDVVRPGIVNRVAMNPDHLQALCGPFQLRYQARSGLTACVLGGFYQ